MSRIQAPGNVFDERAITARGVASPRLDLRSIYLQGTLIEDPDSAERRAPGTGPLARAVRQAAAEVSGEPEALLVSAMLTRLALGDRLVIGVDTPEQILVVARGASTPPEIAREFAERVRTHAPSSVGDAALDPRAWAPAPKEFAR